VTDLVSETERRLAERRIRSLDDVRKCGEVLVAFSPAVRAEKESLEAFLMKKMYRHERVMRVFNRARRYLSDIFGHYMERPDLLPPEYRDRIAAEGAKTVICDYVAGMTDRFALDEWSRFFGPMEKL